MRIYIKVALLTFFISVPVLCQGRAIFAKPKASELNQTFVGLIRKVIIEATETTPLRETFVLQKDGEYGLTPVTGEGLGTMVNQRVLLSGFQNIRTKKITVVSVQFLEPLVQVSDEDDTQSSIPFGIPWGRSDLDTGTKPYLQIMPKVFTFPTYPTVGDRKTLVILVNFQNDQSQPMAKTAIESRFFAGNGSGGQYSVRDYYRHNTQTTDPFTAQDSVLNITGDVVDWVTIPFDNTNCEQNLTNWTNAGVNQAQLSGYDVSQYKNIVFFWPAIPNCSIAAQATVGIKGDNSITQYAYIQLSPLLQTDQNAFLEIVGHEFGHELGEAHAKGITLTGILWEYGDHGDIMASNHLSYSNIYNRLAMGWFQGRATILNGPGSYTVFLFSPAENSKNSKTAIIMVRDSSGALLDWVYILERRKDLVNPYEWFPGQYQPYTTGLSIRKAPRDLSLNTSHSTLIDTTFENPPFTNFDNADLQPDTSVCR